MRKKRKKKKSLIKLSVLKWFSILPVFLMSFLWGAFTFNNFTDTSTLSVSDQDKSEIAFPVGVYPSVGKITEHPDVDIFYKQFVYADGSVLSMKKNWFTRTVNKIALMPWYQNLASLSSRTLVIYSGERKEEVAYNFSRILDWDDLQKKQFLQIIEDKIPVFEEGKFYPGRYVVPKESSPEDVAQKVIGKFETEILSHYDDSVESVVPLSKALTIASLLEREAYDFNDMRYISGILWNRIFIDMNLQIDATLQYARANLIGGKWWPTPRPQDKNIDSLFNTYLHSGLPPHPISNPSAEAILAALNPKNTECLYYFHDKNAGFHCSNTYKEHKALIEEYY